MSVRIPPITVRTEGLPGFYPDRHRYCHLNGALLKNNCFVSAPVVFDELDGQLKMPTGVLAVTDKMIGIAPRNQWNRLEVEETTPYRFYVRSGDAPYIMSAGEITVYAEKPITKMFGQVFVRVVAEGENTRLYTVSDTAGTGLIEMGGCRFVELSTAPGIVWIEARF